MDAQAAIDICRSSIWLAVLIAAPALVAGTAIALLIGLLQALTSIQEQTLGQVLKILVMVMVISLLFPWMVQHMLDFTSGIFEDISVTMIGQL